MKRTVRPLTGGSGYIVAAWVSLVAAIVAGIFGVYRMMSPAATVGVDAANAAMLAHNGAECMCLAVLLALIAAVFAALGIHRQVTVMALAIGPSFQGSHGSDDDT